MPDKDPWTELDNAFDQMGEAFSRIGKAFDALRKMPDDVSRETLVIKNKDWRWWKIWEPRQVIKIVEKRTAYGRSFHDRDRTTP